MSHRRHIALQVLTAAIALAVVLGVAVVLILQSAWFRERVRERMIAEIETATGARAEIANFSFDWKHLTATVAPLILHGKEDASQAPLAQLGSVTVGLRIISMLERRVDLASLEIDKPAVHLIVYPDGSTNIPAPRVPASNGNWARNLIDLAVQHYEIARGTFQLDQRIIPLNLRGENLRLAMDYQGAGAKANYLGRLSSRQVQVQWGQTPPLSGGVDAAFRLDGERAQFTRLRLTTALSRADLVGALTDLRAPRGQFSVKAAVNAADIMPLVAPTVPITGRADFNGNLAISFGEKFDFDISGRADARGVNYHDGRVSFDGATAAGTFRATPKQVSFRDVSGEVLGAQYTAVANLESGGRYHVEGSYDNAGIRPVLALLTDQPIAWNGVATGTMTVDGKDNTNAVTRIVATISPLPGGGTPIEGQLDLTYDQLAGTLRFGDSRLSTAATNAVFMGTLGQALSLRVRTSNLDDIPPALALASKNAPKVLPVKLDGGEASLEGAVTGTLDQPQFRGQVSATKILLDIPVKTGTKDPSRGWLKIDQFKSNIHATQQEVALEMLTLAHGETRITGDAGIALGLSDPVGLSGNQRDFSEGRLSGRLTFAHLDLNEAAKELGSGSTVTVSGLVSGTVQLAGTLQQPDVESTFEANKLLTQDQSIDRLKGTFRYSRTAIEVRQAEADIGSGRLQFSGTFTHPEGDFASGTIHLVSNLQAMPAHAIEAWHHIQPEGDALIDGKWTVDASFKSGGLSIQSLNGNASARAIRYRATSLGEMTLTAASIEQQLTLQAAGKLHEGTSGDTVVTGKGQWSLEGDNPGGATIQFPRISVDTLHDLVDLGNAPGKALAQPPFQGYLEGDATVKVSLRQPKNFQADLTIRTLEFRPRSSQAISANLQRLNLQAQDIQLRNTQPIVIALNAKEARIRSAHFSARDTDLEATGLLPFTSGSGADFAIKGTVNLGILQLLNADLLARGSASVTASVRGSLQEPAVSGRMELTNASLYLTDVSNGVDRANGVILFDRNRATIERLTAETGGGQIALKGSLEFGEELVYRLQAEAQQVRVRYPEDVSITASAKLALNGTSAESTLSGTLTLSRAGITQGADIGRVLAQASQPASSPAEGNEYLRGMRFDVHIESSPAFQMDTSLTRNIQAEVNLRLRGTPAAPALAGTISASSGEVQMFGNRYTVNRGDIRFANPIKIEPILDLDLETRARGIVVNVTVTGSPQKLNVNYSSDPPLQSREIIALLASGRDPNALTQNAQIGSGTAATGLGDAGGLLGEAFSEQLSNRLQRFFGSSRVKIDPQITGVDSLPSARLTLEQQVSRDVTLIYTTNLNRTQEQVVRLEWDLTQTWSAVAVRDANGFFGVDFQYRKRFK